MEDRPSRQDFEAPTVDHRYLLRALDRVRQVYLVAPEWFLDVEDDCDAIRRVDILDPVRSLVVEPPHFTGFE